MAALFEAGITSPEADASQTDHERHQHERRDAHHAQLVAGPALTENHVRHRDQASPMTIGVR